MNFRNRFITKQESNLYFIQNDFFVSYLSHRSHCFCLHHYLYLIAVFLPVTFFICLSSTLSHCLSSVCFLAIYHLSVFPTVYHIMSVFPTVYHMSVSALCPLMTWMWRCLRSPNASCLRLLFCSSCCYFSSSFSSNYYVSFFLSLSLSHPVLFSSHN